MTEIPIPVSKIGASWVLKLKKETRQMLNISKVGEILFVKKEGEDEESEAEDYNSD